MLRLAPLGTVLRQGPGEPSVHPTDPRVAALPVQRRLGPDEVTELVSAYRQGVGVNDLAASFGVNRTTVLGHVRRQGVPKRTRRRLNQDDLAKAVQLYSTGRSAEAVAEELHVAASTVRRSLKNAGVAVRPRGRPRGRPRHLG